MRPKSYSFKITGMVKVFALTICPKPFNFLFPLNIRCDEVSRNYFQGWPTTGRIFDIKAKEQMFNFEKNH